MLSDVKDSVDRLLTSNSFPRCSWWAARDALEAHQCWRTILAPHSHWMLYRMVNLFLCRQAQWKAFFSAISCVRTWGSMQDQGGCDAYHLPVPFCPKLLAGTPVWSIGGHHHRSTWSAAPPRSRSKQALRDLDPLVLLAALEAEEWSCLPWGTQDTEANADGLQGGRGAAG